MAKQASKTVIGAFVVGAVVLAVIGVLIFGSGRFLKERPRWVLYFEGSVKGLSVGSPVMFRGVKVGTVVDIAAVFDPETVGITIPVTIETDPESMSLPAGKKPLTLTQDRRLELTHALIDRGLKGRLELQSMVTGQLMVGLDFYPDKPTEFKGDDKLREIPTIPSSSQELSRALEKLNLQELAANLNSAVAGIERTLNSAELRESIQNLNQALRDAGTLVHGVDGRIGSLAASIDTAVKDYGKLAQNLDKQVGSLASGIDQSLDGIQGLTRNVNGVVEKLDAALEPLPETMVRMRNMSRQLDDLVASQRPNIERTLDNVRVTSQNMKELSENAKQDPSSVLFGRPPAPSKRRK